MNRIGKIIITFIFSFIFSFFLVGYIKNTVFVKIDWIFGATIWDKFREYYIRTFSANILPALIIALIFTFILVAVSGRKTDEDL